MSELRPSPCQTCGANRDGMKARYGRCTDCERARMLAIRGIPCVDCGGLVQRSEPATAPPQCQPCRLGPRTPPPERTCERCCGVFVPQYRKSPQRFCTVACANRVGGVARSLLDRRVARAVREASAPGLNYSARKALRARWKAQGRRCIYCTRPATTIDHVLPLIRGGTNHEGNLAPCCKSCNSSKSGWTVVEWRTGKRLKPPGGVLPWDHARGRRTGRKPPTGQQLALLG